MTGETLLHYEIKDSIGKGGMGEVFRARDTKLGRDVAIKILPRELSGDPEREARFQREARTLASLQHPNVASVYGFEEVDGVRFLVMELITGSDLSVRMKEGPIPLDEVTDLARQIASGLEAAHENGIVHRDLKPANLMETESGEIKILDFGLAQAWFGETTNGAESSGSPTITAAMTQAGAVLGTAAYMAPEQARGGSVDRRADIWAYGVILYEMLTGNRLFQGETVSDTLAAVLRAEPDWEALPRDEAPGLCFLIQRCLDRNPTQRLRDIGEARIFLQDGAASGTHLGLTQLDMRAVSAEPIRSRPLTARLLLTAVACLAVGALAGWKLISGSEPVPVYHAMIPPPPLTDYDLKGAAPGPAALSPDGTMIAFTAVDQERVTRLYLRHLDKGESVALSGTENSAYPFWSPDGDYVAYFDPGEGKLRKVAVAGGPPVTICPAPNGKGGSWNEQGVIIFAPDFDSEIYRVLSTGGDAVQLTRKSPQHESHRHPRFLPDGTHYIFTARQNQSGTENDVMIASLDTTVAPRAIATSQAHADFVQGHLLTVRENVLMAAPFSPDQERPMGGGTPLVENVLQIRGADVGVFAPSRDGLLVFQTGASNESTRTLYIQDIATGETRALGEPGQVTHPVISPDGSLAAVEVRDASNEGADLWLVDLESGLRTRFTFEPGDESRAVWSPDGSHLYYSSLQDSSSRVMRRPVEGRSGATVVYEAARQAYPTDVDPGDSALLLDVEREDGRMDLCRIPAAGGAEPEILVSREDVSSGGGRFSPDGRWIAYHTQSLSGWDIFVIPADGGDRKWQVTTRGAVYPHWGFDGAEIWVVGFSGTIMIVSVDGESDTFRVLGDRQGPAVTSPDGTGSYYDLHPDRARLLQSGDDPAFTSDISYLHLVTDWRRGLVQ